MEIIRIKSLSGYINAIKKIKDGAIENGKEAWFRGVSNENYELVPGTVWRNIKENVHTGIIEEWQNEYLLYSNEELQDGFDIYALAQHYGLPTRLLDWTVSPLIALYFSLEKEEIKDKRVVWAIDPIALNKKMTDWDGHLSVSDRFLRKEHNLDNYLPESFSGNDKSELMTGPISIRVQPRNKRIISQKGCFTIHGTSAESVDKVLEDIPYSIVKMEIYGKKTRDKILNELYLLGVSEDSVFQDLNAFSSRLKRTWGLNS